MLIVIHEHNVYENRLVDRGEVEALFKEVEGVLDAADVEDKKMSYLRAIKKDLETQRAATWTEYRVLPIEQALAQVLPDEALIARAHVRLSDLDEYDEKTPGESQFFYEQRDRVSDAIDKLERKIECPGDAAKQAYARETLREEVKSLLETIAYYNYNWAVGSELLRGLLIALFFTIPFLLYVGIGPIFLTANPAPALLNWTVLGMAGALTAVTRKLYRENKVEVGKTEGKNELYQAMEAAVLGLVAGFVFYALVRGELIGGRFLGSNADDGPLVVAIRSFLWAFIAGFTFEEILERAQHVRT